MKILYFDCFSGISGDMTLSALIDLGISPNKLIDELNKLHLEGWKIRIAEVSKHGVSAKHVDVIIDGEEHAHVHKWFQNHHNTHHNTYQHHHPQRTMADITQIITASDISDNAKELALRIFMRLAVAEAKVHGSTPEEVHFHEVGAVDSIIDIVGTAICIDILSPDKIYASVLHDGYGFVKCQHGTIPVPVPAVVEVLAARGVGFKQLDVEGELLTPTGAAIMAELSESFGAMPEMKVMKTGYGAGTKDTGIPNLLRIVYGESMAGTLDAEHESVTVIETNIDDTTPEALGYVMTRLMEAGARDVFFTPVYMKKCRPATLLTILCDEAEVLAMEHILFTETSTIGLRKHTAARTCLPRKIVTVETPYGDVKAKEIRYQNAIRQTIEYDDACRLAKEKHIPLKWILDRK
ncbi:MAG: nickel pincer cofactor biosynthesis protein LarC [Tannerellaceae bacterium]|jgi:uncharacterized protein (TIGR00299 family) protein|nr:nickel pincer cofactor biosynthesis protein LarC [Tannerellaceae bacterium]